MVNISKIKDLAKSKGISVAYICEQFGTGRGYLNDVARGKNSMSEERVFAVAKILGTSFEYLMDITDDPEPDFIARSAESLENQIVNEMIYRLTAMPAEQQETVSRLLKLPDNEFQRALNMLNLMWGE